MPGMQSGAPNTVTDEYEAFWLEKLAGQTAIELPYADHRRAATEPARYGAVGVPEVQEIGLCQGADCHGIGRTDFLTAAVVMYLARLSDAYTFDVGFSDSRLRRQAVESEGVWSSHVPVHVELDPHKQFSTSLESLHRELATTRQHGSFARDLADRHPELGVKRNRDGQPVWSVVVEQVESCDEYTPIAGCDLIVLCAEDGLAMMWLYDACVFADDEIMSMRHHFVTFLRNAVRDEQGPVGRIPLLTEAEFHRLTVEWNDTRVEYPQDRCLHQVFEIQAEKTPDRVAVVFEGERLTYADLNRRANQLAHWLRSEGVGPDVHVGIAVERSLELLVGLYAILKAGAAYVPLEPGYPEERIAEIVQDAEIPIVLTQAHLRHVLPPAGARILCMDTEWDALIAGQSIENPDGLGTMENLAYTIYTSGSTGKPKGVMNTHRGILNRLCWMQDTYGLTASDRVLHKTPFSFDVSVWELFWPCMYGASLIVARPEGHKDNDYLVRIIVDQQITVTHFVPSMLQLFLQAPNVKECRSLRDVICSGEALPADLRDRFFAQLDARLHNLYGPTEAAVDVTFWQCRRGDRSTIVPIGRPVANTQIYILDRLMQPVPVGIPAELYIGGVQVARGYLNRPELTAERFVPDPFRDEPGARLYKTGDLARYHPDGNIEYLGRSDHQVKLQGFRIELGEIESVLCRHPAVREAVVTVYGDTPADKRLVAYMVSELGSPVSDRLVRDYLKRRLPDHMVPSVFMWLEALPLNPNGKLDRRRLPAPVGERLLKEACHAPCDEMEKTMAGIWRDVLKTSNVGVDDNFFELGGNSFLSILAVDRMREALRVDIPVTRLFQYPTIASLARCLRPSHGDSTASQSILARAERRKKALSRERRLVK